MAAGKVMLMALVACSVFVIGLKTVEGSELSRSNERTLLLKEHRQFVIRQLVDYVDSMECPNEEDLICCMRGSQHIMTKVFESVAIMMDMGELISKAEGSIKSAEDFVKTKTEELEYQAGALASWPNLSPKSNAVVQLINIEASKFLKMARNPVALDDELKGKSEEMHSKMVATKKMAILRLVDHVRDLKCKDDALLDCIEKNRHVIKRIGDIFSFAKLEGETKALKEGHVKGAKDFVRGAIEGLEKTKEHKLHGSTRNKERQQKQVDVFAQVFHKELDQLIKFLSSLP